MDEGFFLYKVTYWNSCDECEQTETGALYADTWTHAMEKLERAYGLELMTVHYLEGLEPMSVLIIPEKCFKEVKNAN